MGCIKNYPAACPDAAQQNNSVSTKQRMQATFPFGVEWNQYARSANNSTQLERRFILPVPLVSENEGLYV
uniref:Uncharacterized protein n=1 Tax=mine drainage metagenome TaxID=410659 RepID=E6QL29_9ZZZZ